MHFSEFRAPFHTCQAPPLGGIGRRSPGRRRANVLGISNDVTDGERWPSFSDFRTSEKREREGSTFSDFPLLSVNSAKIAAPPRLRRKWPSPSRIAAGVCARKSCLTLSDHRFVTAETEMDANE